MPARTPAIPNLFHTEPDARRLYQWYLGRLTQSGQYEAAVAACRRIRQHAKRTVGAEAGLFTWFEELESLYSLGDYRAAWRQLLRYGQEALGYRLDLNVSIVSGDVAELVGGRHAPLQYFLQHYGHAQQLLEHALAFAVGSGFSSSFVLQRVYQSDNEPWHPVQVTLFTIYRKLGKTLDEWPLWPQFVRQFPKSVLKRASVSADELTADPMLLPGISRASDSRLNRRPPSDDSSNREKRHRDTVDRFREIDRRLQKLFPGLEDTQPLWQLIEQLSLRTGSES